MSLPIKPEETCRWDLVALGEVMLRLDPGDGRIHTARNFQAWEGGGEYNVARGLKRCFGLNTAVVTAFADNPVGVTYDPEELVRNYEAGVPIADLLRIPPLPEGKTPWDMLSRH